MRFSVRKSGRTRAATLIEVMVTVGMVAVVGLSALLAITYGLYSQQQIHERNGAARIAGEVLEEQRKILFQDLAPAVWTPEEPRPAGNSIYDHGTPDNDSDDTVATVELKFFDKEDNELAAITTNEKVRAEVTVTWQSAGRAELQALRLNTIIAP